MMAGYEVGFFAAAGVQALLLPRFGWRSLFFVGVAPALLAIFIRVGIRESPVWLRTRAQARDVRPTRSSPPPRRFRVDAAAWQACLVMAALQVQAAAVYNFYPTLLKTDRGFAAAAAYSVGSIIGRLVCGWATSRVGERPVIFTCLAVVGIVPFAGASAIRAADGVAPGSSSSGVFALAPHVLSRRFADAVRSFGMGLAYAVASFARAVATYVIPATGREVGLARATEVFVVAASFLIIAAVFREPRDLPGTDAAAT